VPDPENRRKPKESLACRVRCYWGELTVFAEDPIYGYSNSKIDRFGQSLRGKWIGFNSVKRNKAMKKKIETMTKAELYEEAQRLNLAGRSKMTKEALIKALSDLSRKERPTSTRVVRKVAKPALPPVEPEIKPAETSSTVLPPPHPTAPQYLTPAPVEVYRGEEGPSLPDRLPMTVLQAMPRDPHWIFLYWDIADEDRQKIRTEHGQWVFERSLSVLRIREQESGEQRDIPILLDAKNWYLPVHPDRAYQFELGLMTPDGRYISVAASEPVRTPTSEPSFLEEEEWLAVEERYRELVDIYGEFVPGSFPGSPRGERHLKREAARMIWSGLAPISSRSGRPR